MAREPSEEPFKLPSSRVGEIGRDSMPWVIDSETKVHQSMAIVVFLLERHVEGMLRAVETRGIDPKQFLVDAIAIARDLETHLKISDEKNRVLSIRNIMSSFLLTCSLMTAAYDETEE